MSKAIGLAYASVFLFLMAKPQSVKFSSKYQTVEAYEIRPGILMMPRYSDNGQVCEIGLERRHYSPDKINLDSSLSRKEIDGIFDELAPADERGPKSKDLDELIERGGQSITTSVEFEKASIQIFSEELAGGHPLTRRDGFDFVFSGGCRTLRC